MEYVSFALILSIALYYRFKPNFELTPTRDVLLFYKTGKYTRSYTHLFKLP